MIRSSMTWTTEKITIAIAFRVLGGGDCYSPDILPAIWGPAVSNHCPCPSAGRKGRAVPSVVQSVSMFSHLCSQLIDLFSDLSKENYQGTQLERVSKQNTTIKIKTVSGFFCCRVE